MIPIISLHATNSFSRTGTQTTLIIQLTKDSQLKHLRTNLSDLKQAKLTTRELKKYQIAFSKASGKV